MKETKHISRKDMNRREYSTFGRHGNTPGQSLNKID
jgi:hypothetical protein